jgi:hypothetical protein
LAFTDDFVDNHRRLDAERRRQRSQVVLETAVRNNPTLRSISWPVCQQDEDVMEEIRAVLSSR